MILIKESDWKSYVERPIAGWKIPETLLLLCLQWYFSGSRWNLFNITF